MVASALRPNSCAFSTGPRVSRLITTVRRAYCRPHWISVAYFPNWRAEGAKGPYLSSPAFLMVVPEGPRVRLVFRRIAVDWLGIAASLAGVLAVAWLARRHRRHG